MTQVQRKDGWIAKYDSSTGIISVGGSPVGHFDKNSLKVMQGDVLLGRFLKEKEDIDPYTKKFQVIFFCVFDGNDKPVGNAVINYSQGNFDGVTFRKGYNGEHADILTYQNCITNFQVL